MAKEFERIAEEAGQLPDQQKLALAGLLIEWAERGQEAGAAAAWEAEIQARIKAIDDGRAVAVDYEEVLRQLDRRLST